MQERAGSADAQRREFDQHRCDLCNPGGAQYAQNQACGYRKDPIDAPHVPPLVDSLAQLQHKVAGRQVLILLGKQPRDYGILIIAHGVAAH
jgi:hypothetical protein